MSKRAEEAILGVRIDSISWRELDDYCNQAFLGNLPKHIVTANGEILLKASTSLGYKEILNGADLVLPESTNVAWVLALKGTPFKNIISGADLVDRLAEIAVKTHKSIFLLGSKEGIAAKAGEKLQRLNSGLEIAGSSSANPDDTAVVEQIKHANADIVLVAYGAPKQEEWIAKHKSALGAKILVGIGGTFDMLADVTPRAPKFLRSAHLEWLWRLMLQPSRIGRIWRAVVMFPLKAIFNN